jgi:tetratricopeptide (TPR) repeat protein
MTDRQHPPHRGGGGKGDGGGGAGGPWWRRLLIALGLARPACAVERLTPDEELTIAFRAFSDGDIPHAAHHVAGALMADPEDRRALGLLDRMIAKSDDPLSMAPLGAGRKGTWAGTGAVRAYVHAKLGQYREAMMLVVSIQQSPDANIPPFWRWAARWLAEPGVAAQCEAAQGVSFLTPLVMQYPGVVVHDPAARAELEFVRPAADALAAAFPASGPIATLRSLLLRKAGHTEEAIRAAEAAYAAEPSYASAVARAMARQAAGDVEGTIAGYRDAIRFEPDDPGARADIAILLMDHGRLDEAVTWATEALAYDPKQQTAAAPLLMLLNFRLGRGPEWLTALYEFADKHPGHGWAGQLAASLRPYVDYLPGPADATVNIGRQLMAEHGMSDGKAELKVTVTSIEAPSVRRSVEAQLCAGGGSLRVTAEAVPSPDPRVPSGPVDHLLWRYDGNDAEPALPPPPAGVADAVAALARQPYDLERWTAGAREVGRSLGPDAVGEILATMLHPPSPAPDGTPAWDWLRQVQHAAALVAAHVDGGWAGSARRGALVSLARGPVDWTTEAGIVALGQVAREAELPADARREIVDLLADLANRLPDRGHCVYPGALAAAVNRLPDAADESTRRRFAKLWEYFEQEAKADAEEAGAAAREGRS